MILMEFPYCWDPDPHPPPVVPTKIHQARGSGDTSQADLLHAFRLLETQTSQQKHGAKGLQAKDKAVADAQRDNFFLILLIYTLED